MLAVDMTPWNLAWLAFGVWAVWMCVVILLFVRRGGSKTWQHH